MKREVARLKIMSLIGGMDAARIKATRLTDAGRLSRTDFQKLDRAGSKAMLKLADAMSALTDFYRLFNRLVGVQGRKAHFSDW